MIDFKDAIKMARATHHAIDNLLEVSNHSDRLERELRDTHAGQGNGGEFEDWLKDMADNDNGTLQKAAIELCAWHDLEDMMYAHRRFLINAGEEL